MQEEEKMAGGNAQVLDPGSPEPLSVTEGFHLRREM